MKPVRNKVSLEINQDRTATTNLMLCSEVENRLIETYMKHQQHIEPNGKQRIGAVFYLGNTKQSSRIESNSAVKFASQSRIFG